MAVQPTVVSPRRCARRRLGPEGPRPSELLAAFFTAGLAALLAALAAACAYAVSGAWWLHWLALHLAFLGGISQLVLGAGQFFVCAFLATEPPPLALTRAQLVAWNAGTVLVAVGVSADAQPATYAGAALIAAGLVLFGLSLRRMERRSLRRAPWALRWYQASAACLGAGALAGVLMAAGTPWPEGSLLGAHLALNLGGWLGTAIVGTLHTFFPSVTQTELRRPGLQAPTFALWVAGVAALAGGAAFAGGAVVACGSACLLGAAALLAVNLGASLHAAPRPLSLPARLLGAAQPLLAAGLLVAFLATISGGAGAPFSGAPQAALAVLLAAGWIGLTVTGALLHLLAVLGRVRHLTAALPRPRPRRDGAVTAAAVLAVAALALSHAPGLRALGTPAALALAAVAATLAAAVVALAVRAAVPLSARRDAAAPARPRAAAP